MIKPKKIYRSNRKTLAINIDKMGDLIVRAPYFCSQKRIDNFVESKTDWIEKRQNKIRLTNNKYSIDNLNKDSKIYYLGNQYELKFGDCRKIYIKDNYLIIPITTDNLKMELIKWYKKTARIYLNKRLNDIAIQLSEDDFKFQLSSARTRWGSCSSKRHINLNWKLMLCPEIVIDYIIVHELCHLKEMNHSKKYWQVVVKYMPKYKDIEKWLNNNSGILNIDNN